MPPPLTSNLDFLAETAAVLINLTPDEDGVVTIDRKKLGTHQHLHIAAADPLTTAFRQVSLPEQQPKRIDLRLSHGLDPAKDFTQQKRVSLIKAGEKFVMADIVTSKFEVYDTLADVYGLYATLSRDAQLIEFSFLLKWPTLKPEEKQQWYSKYACHELNFFLYKKDPQFFNTVIKPYLANKKNPTFLDRWLLGRPLESYLLPWNYEQLNIAERILLTQRVAADRENGQRHIRDLFQLIPPDLDRFNLLFRTAIRGSSLETEDRFGVEGGF